MEKSPLTKKEALELVTAVVDGEVNEETRRAFFASLQYFGDVRRQFQSEKAVKQLLRERMPREKAPAHLRSRIRYLLSDDIPGGADEQEWKPDQPDPPSPSSSLTDLQGKGNLSYTAESSRSMAIWKIAAAALLLAGVILAGIFWEEVGQTTYNVEEYALTHFQEHNGRLIEPTIQTASIADAELEVSERYDFSLNIPSLDKADFMGVVWTDFVPDFKAPLLEYYLPSEDQYIYIFAIDIDRLQGFRNLVRDQEAIQTCQKPKDYHIREIDGKHIVSWRWENMWYAAISNHKGDTLASLIKQLN